VRVLAGILGIVGTLGIAAIAMFTCDVGRNAPKGPVGSDPGQISDLIRVGQVLIGSAAVALALNVAMIQRRLPRIVPPVLAAVGLAAAACLGLLMAVLITRAA
jgi:hypothetical protein